MAFSQPNQPSNPIVIGVSPILQTLNHEQVLKLQNTHIWVVSDLFTRWPTLRIEITHINANGIKYNKKALIHNDGITSRIIDGTESIHKQAIYEYRDNGRVDLYYLYEYRDNGRVEYLFKDVERNIIKVFANKLEIEVTPTQVLKLGILKRFWREITPSGTLQNMRKLKITLDPQKYKKNHINDVKMDEDQDGSDNILDFSNWENRYDGIYGVSESFSGLKNGEVFPSTWTVIGQLVSNNNGQKLPASSVPMGSDQQ
eukprot:416714_1